MRRITMMIFVSLFVSTSLVYGDTLFFDDFETNLDQFYDPDLSQGETVISNDVYYNGSGSLMVHGSDLDGTNGPSKISTDTNWDVETATIDFYYLINISDTDRQGRSSINLYDSDDNLITLVSLWSQNHVLDPPEIDPVSYTNDVPDGQALVDSSDENFTVSFDTWYYVSIFYGGDSSSVNIYDPTDDNLLFSSTSFNTNSAAGNLAYISLYSSKQGYEHSYSYFDDLTVSGDNPVPEPATMLLFGTGVVGLIGSRLRRKKK